MWWAAEYRLVIMEITYMCVHYTYICQKNKSQAPAGPKASYSQPPIKGAKGKDCFIHFMFV